MKKEKKVQDMQVKPADVRVADELKNMVDYYCSKNGSLNPFRESMGVVLS